MQKYRHLKLETDEFGHIMNICPNCKRHKNGALIYIDDLACRQCRMYHGLDDDGQVVCGYGVDNVTKNKLPDTYKSENKD